MARRLTWRIGRRGAVLILFGMIFVFLGAGYIGPLPETTTDQLFMATQVFPMKFWAICWSVVGAVGIVNAFYPPGKDSYGFIVMGTMSYLWAALILIGYAQEQPPRGLILGILFATFGAALTIISGWPEPRKEQGSA